MYLLGSTIAAFLFSAMIILCALSRDWLRFLPQDYPNSRSLHMRPVPRFGGVVIVTVVLMVWIAASGDIPRPAWGALFLMLTSFFDDRDGLPVWIRLPVQVVVITVTLVPMFLDIPAIFQILGVLTLTWFVNLYNFMDGSDGMVGGASVVGFGLMGSLAAGVGASAIAMPALPLAGAVAGFLLFNRPPARIFLGDGGSIPLGYLAATLGLMGGMGGMWPLSFPVVVFGPLVIDATWTLMERIGRRERIWEGHRQHLYQRLILGGIPAGRVGLSYHFVMLAGGVLMIQSGMSDWFSWAWLLLLAGIRLVLGNVFPVIAVERPVHGTNLPGQDR